MPSEPTPDHELSAVLHDLEAAEPPVASTPPGIDAGVDSGGDRSAGSSAWQLWELSTPTARSR